MIGGLTLRHEPACGPVTHEIAGHMHPAAKISLYGHALRRPCFVGNGRRMILPAFGAYTGGLNVLDAAFEPLFGNDGFNVCMMGHEGLYPVATRLLRED
jgi:metallophosphoesterase superfamily enzyme